MLIYLKYIRKNVPPFIFRVEVLPKKSSIENEQDLYYKLFFLVKEICFA